LDQILDAPGGYRTTPQTGDPRDLVTYRMAASARSPIGSGSQTWCAAGADYQPASRLGLVQTIDLLWGSIAKEDLPELAALPIEAYQREFDPLP